MSAVVLLFSAKTAGKYRHVYDVGLRAVILVCLSPLDVDFTTKLLTGGQCPHYSLRQTVMGNTDRCITSPYMLTHKAQIQTVT